MTKVLFVCMGNICRSPMAEGMFRKAVQDAGLNRDVEADSAGTHAYHIGSAPDPRARQAVRQRGVDISGLRGRKVADDDFERFDYILVMDGDNYNRLNPSVHRRNTTGKIRRLLSFSRKYPNLDVVRPVLRRRTGLRGKPRHDRRRVQGLIREITGDSEVKMRSGRDRFSCPFAANNKGRLKRPLLLWRRLYFAWVSTCTSGSSAASPRTCARRVGWRAAAGVDASATSTAGRWSRPASG